MSYFGFDGLIANTLVFQDGIATGLVASPLIAEESKVKAMISLCRQYGVDIRRAKAYSDSFSDVPMLEAVGYPCAVNPDRRLRKIAEARGLAYPRPSETPAPGPVLNEEIMPTYLDVPHAEPDRLLQSSAPAQRRRTRSAGFVRRLCGSS